jgi:peptide chain release factor subunit 1
LVIFCGTVYGDNGKVDKEVRVNVEPIFPVTRFIFKSENKFYTEELASSLNEEPPYGYVIVDGHGVLFGKLQGKVSEVLKKTTTDLPNKHKKGGQSQHRFERNTELMRADYVKKVAEQVNATFMPNGESVNVEAIIVGGPGELKSELKKSDTLDKRVRAKIAKVLDLANGDEQGFA